MHHLDSYKWKPGTQSPNPNGRPPKLTTILKRQGITQTQCNDLILQILTMTRNEIEHIAADESASMFERIISNALIHSHRHSNLNALEPLLNRTLGMPKQSVSIQEKPIYNINLDLGIWINQQPNKTTPHKSLCVYPLNYTTKSMLK